MIEITSGGTQYAKSKKLTDVLIFNVMAGQMTETHFLNYSSEDRAEAREYYLSKALVMGVPAICIGNFVVNIGWNAAQRNTFRSFRGSRLRRVGHHVQYWNWRKWKRYIRKVAT